MNIVISNIVTLNMGDAAILRGEMRILKHTCGQNTRFVIFDSQPDASKKYYPDLTFRKMLYLRLPHAFARVPVIGNLVSYLGMFRLCTGALALRFNAHAIAEWILPKAVYNDLCEYHSADLVVSTGGTILVENYDLTPRWLDFAVTLILNKPLVLFTQSLGPFRKPLNKFLAKLIFNRAEVIFLRDDKSRNHLVDIGITSRNLYVCADAAFAFVDPCRLKEGDLREEQSVRGFNVAVSVREWRHFKTIDPTLGIMQYKSAICALCHYLVGRYHARVTFLSTCQGIPEYWTNDATFAADIIATLPADISARVELNDRFHRPEEMIDLLRDFDFVISTRLHMGILSLCAGTPVFSFAYEFKTKELFKRLNMPQFALDIEQLNDTKVTERLEQFIQSMPAMRKQLVADVAQQRKLAYRAKRILKAKLRIHA
jgi:colanic acid/amylovoran biosynthesis protein